MNTIKLLSLLTFFAFVGTGCKKIVKGCTNPASSNYNSEATEDDGTCKHVPKLGDSFEGGIVFYVDGTGQHGLVAANTDQGSAITWLNSIVSATGATFADVGKGAYNTGAIVNVYGPGTYAAKVCDDLVSGGHSDWFLPSKEELKLIYTNLHLKNLGNLSFSFYWSSTEVDDNNAMAIEFSSGALFTSTKITSYSVRAARAF